MDQKWLTANAERRHEARGHEAPVPQREEARLGVEGQVGARPLRVVVGRAELGARGAEGPAGDDAGDHFGVSCGAGERRGLVNWTDTEQLGRGEAFED